MNPTRAFRNLLVFILLFAALPLLARLWSNAPTAVNAASTSNRFPLSGYILDNPIVTIAGQSVTTSATPVTGTTVAHVQWLFGTVAGSYGSCTVTAKTSFDGTNFLTLGSPASITVTTGALNAWDIYQQGSVNTGVTVSTPSSSAAVGFGLEIEYAFACSGGYGTSAPVTIRAIYQ